MVVPDVAIYFRYAWLLHAQRPRPLRLRCASHANGMSIPMGTFIADLDFIII